MVVAPGLRKIIARAKIYLQSLSGLTRSPTSDSTFRSVPFLIYLRESNERDGVKGAVGRVFSLLQP